jgi:predicted ferric reductase
VARTDQIGSTLEVELEPTTGRRLGQQTGQFAVIKLQVPGLREPHVFTVASSPTSETLRFYIRDLGDWTSRLAAADLVGAKATVEGPYGHFRPLPDEPGRRVVWVAGGVGITPFLAAADDLPVAPESERPTLAYCVRHADDAIAVGRLRAADQEGRIRLRIFESSSDGRFDPSTSLARLTDDGSLRGAHVAVCGPSSLVVAVAEAAHRAGAADVETEDFDIRSGVGPDLSRAIDDLVRRPPTESEPATVAP